MEGEYALKKKKIIVKFATQISKSLSYVENITVSRLPNNFILSYQGQLCYKLFNSNCFKSTVKGIKTSFCIVNIRTPTN